MQFIAKSLMRKSKFAYHLFRHVSIKEIHTYIQFHF